MHFEQQKLKQMNTARHRMRSLVVITIILYQSFVIAPLANLSLAPESAALFLRSIWPIFFVLIGGIGVTGVIQKNHTRARNINLITVVSMIACIILVPRINLAMDTGNIALWKILHMATVGLTLASLILHILFAVRWHHIHEE
mgnify:FL=1